MRLIGPDNSKSPEKKAVPEPQEAHSGPPGGALVPPRPASNPSGLEAFLPPTIPQEQQHALARMQPISSPPPMKHPNSLALARIAGGRATGLAGAVTASLLRQGLIDRQGRAFQVTPQGREALTEYQRWMNQEARKIFGSALNSVHYVYLKNFADDWYASINTDTGCDEKRVFCVDGQLRFN